MAKRKPTKRARVKRRMIYHEIFYSPDFIDFTMADLALVIGMIVIADDDGVFVHQERFLRAAILHQRRFKSARMAHVLRTMEDRGVTQACTKGGRKCMRFLNWRTFQRLQKHFSSARTMKMEDDEDDEAEGNAAADGPSEAELVERLMFQFSFGRPKAEAMVNRGMTAARLAAWAAHQEARGPRLTRWLMSRYDTVESATGALNATPAEGLDIDAAIADAEARESAEAQKGDENGETTVDRPR